MAAEPTKHPSIGFLGAFSGGSWLGIVYLIGWGVPTNALHVSAMSAFFGLLFAIVVAYGAPNIIGTWKQ